MFEGLRIQIVEPCRARCRWCGTWKRNPKFLKMKEDGAAEKIHSFYADAVRHFKPRVLYVSGGEPLLMEGIGSYMATLAPYVSKIHLFTSFQFSASTRERLDLEHMPWDKVVLTHTMAGFEPGRWDYMTRGFPFDVYVDNIRELSRHPWRKHFKFIVNNDTLPDEIRRFTDTVQPDDTFHFSLKLVNDHPGGIGRSLIEDTRHKIIQALNGLDMEGLDTRLTGEEVLRAQMNEGDGPSACPYRQEPKELRFALYTSGRAPKLKYRFCPHFPSNKHFIFKIGRDEMQTIRESFQSRRWHSWCSSCRLLEYVEGDS